MTDVEMIDTNKASDKKEEPAPEEPKEPTDQFYGKTSPSLANLSYRAQEMFRSAWEGV